MISTSCSIANVPPTTAAVHGEHADAGALPHPVVRLQRPASPSAQLLESHQGLVWCGVVWCGVVWCGVVWCGVVRFGVV